MLEYNPRSEQEILDDLVTNKESRPELDDLDNPSGAAVWYNLLAVVSTEIAQLEDNGVSLYNQIEERAQEIPVGTLFWYAAETLNYQHGDNLEIINGIPQYAIIDESKKIIKASAAVEQSGQIIIKCAKEDLSGDLEPLDPAELAGVVQYWVEKRFAGSALSVFSTNPDLVAAYLRIEIDGQVLSLDGESLANPGTYPVEDAIIQYYKDLDFGGRFSVMSLIDAVQSVNGTANTAPESVLITPDGGSRSPIEVLADEDQIFVTVAGYCSEDPANILRDTLTYYIRQ
jgi:hypothetical protein